MSENDVDALFAEMTADIELDEPEVENVQSLDDLALIEKYNDLRQSLLDLGQLIHPTTQEARDMHSSFAACKVELMRRKHGS